MKITSSQKIGFFVIAIVIALFFLINFLKGYDLFNKKNTYYTYLTEVEGLTATAPVYIRGLKVGSIDKIEFDPVRDKFMLALNVKRDYVIPIDSRAEVYSSDLLGGKALRIALGTAQLHASSGDTLMGKSIPDMFSILYGQFVPLKDKIYGVLENLDSVLISINSTLDAKAQQDLKSSLSKLNHSLTNIEALSGSLNKMTPQLNSSLSNINTITTSLSAPDGDLNRVLGNINKTTEELSKVKLAQTVNELNALLAQLRSPESTTGKLLSTDKLHNSVDSLVNEINSLVQRIKENPKRYFKISVF